MDPIKYSKLFTDENVQKCVENKTKGLRFLLWPTRFSIIKFDKILSTNISWCESNEVNILFWGRYLVFNSGNYVQFWKVVLFLYQFNEKKRFYFSNDHWLERIYPSTKVSSHRKSNNKILCFEPNEPTSRIHCFSKSFQGTRKIG